MMRRADGMEVEGWSFMAGWGRGGGSALSGREGWCEVKKFI